jgi:hypothetical protein
MGACMDFPEDIKDFINSYSFKDNKEVYTNGSDLIEVYRVEQALEHYMPRWIPTEERLPEQDGEYLVCLRGGWRMVDSYTAVKMIKASGTRGHTQTQT